MGVSNVVIQELTEKVVQNIVDIIIEKKDKEDKPVRKICDQCIRYITYEKEKIEDTEKSIEIIESRLKDNASFYTVLLAILYDDIEDDELALKHYTEFSYSSLAEPFKEDLQDYIVMAKFFNMNDHSLLEKVGLIYLNKYSQAEVAVGFLYQLCEHVNPQKNYDTFMSLAYRAKELFPEENNIEAFKGYINSKNDKHEKALESYLLVKDNLEKDHEHPIYNLNLASTWNSIAHSYLKIGKPEKTLESCDIALSYNEKSEDISIEDEILIKKSEALLMLNRKEDSRTIALNILKESPEHLEARAIIEKIG